MILHPTEDFSAGFFCCRIWPWKLKKFFIKILILCKLIYIKINYKKEMEEVNLASQKISCMVDSCRHNGQDNCCELKSIKISETNDRGKVDHETLCSNFESVR